MNPENSASARAASLHSWYRRPLGCALAEAEQSALAGQLGLLFGYHLVIIDPPWPSCELEDSRIAHRVIQGILPESCQGTSVSADPDSWPLQTDSIDAIILPHTLELAASPHQVLREAERCLIPDGHLIIMGFNPFSSWGVRHLLARRSNRLPWGARFRSLHRVKDWLDLLGFDTLHTQYLFQRPPVQSRRALQRLQFMEPRTGQGLMLLSAGYLLVARKRTVVMTPLRELQRVRKRLFPVGLPSSSQGNVRRVS